MTAVDPSNPRLSFISLNELVDEPMEGAVLLRNVWWSIHPERGAIIWLHFHPQYNHHESISRSLTERLYPWAEVRFFQMAFLPARCIAPN